MPQSRSLPLRALTFDVEEYYHIEAAYPVIGPRRWREWPTRVEAQMELLLSLCQRMGVRSTCFVLGDVARRNPGVVRAIAEAGHEIASHGSNHDRLHRLSPESFRRDVENSCRMLEDITGKKVRGYRSPSWSLTRTTAWAVDALVNLGLEYDASIFPVARRGYGVSDAPITPHRLASAPGGPTILEFPALVWPTRLGNLPVAGGGYFRLLPLRLMHWGLADAAREQRLSTLYFHPWEFDTGLPIMPLSRLNRLRTYTGLRHAPDRLTQLLRPPARWETLGDMADKLRDDPSLPTFTLANARRATG
ncbi:MAG: polysaccharide deacetylase family protein [Phycisphaeraceae bacterium]|nr:polysaccharide deacetylase family protein [Phycisphaeraceae bacterium]